MKNPTHPQIIEYCELRGLDHTSNDSYNCAKGDLTTLMNMPQNLDKTISEIVETEFA